MAATSMETAWYVMVAFTRGPPAVFLWSLWLNRLRSSMHLVRQYHDTALFKYNHECSAQSCTWCEKKTNGRLELKRSTGNNQSNKHCARPHLRKGSATKQSLTRPRSSMHLVRQDNDITLIRNKQEYSARSYTCFDKTNGRPESKRSALCTHAHLILVAFSG